MKNANCCRALKASSRWKTKRFLWSKRKAADFTADFSFLNTALSRYDVGGKESYAVSAEGQASQSPDLAYACCVARSRTWTLQAV